MTSKAMLGLTKLPFGLFGDFFPKLLKQIQVGERLRLVPPVSSFESSENKLESLSLDPARPLSTSKKPYKNQLSSNKPFNPNQNTTPPHFFFRNRNLSFSFGNERIARPAYLSLEGAAEKARERGHQRLNLRRCGVFGAHVPRHRVDARDGFRHVLLRDQKEGLGIG